MFTGIVRHLGKILSSTPQNDGSIVLEIAAPFSHELSEGDSVAVSGACLTVLSHTDTSWTCRLMAETIKKTTLGTHQAGDAVNLEQPTKAGSLLHGHVVQGHVDGVATVANITPVGDDKVIEFRVPKELIAEVIPKGSVTLDGVSLTVVDVFEDSFTVSFMPYTMHHTTFQHKKVGDGINIEVDKRRKAAWFSGTVVEGDKRGRTLGFPTANIELDSETPFSEEGVFACRVMINSDPTLYAGALHAGPKPTFPDSHPAIEIHLLHFADQNLYGKKVQFTLVEKIRDTKKFASTEELIAAIREDVEKITTLLLKTA